MSVVALWQWEWELLVSAMALFPSVIIVSVLPGTHEANRTPDRLSWLARH